MGIPVPPPFEGGEIPRAGVDAVGGARLFWAFLAEIETESRAPHLVAARCRGAGGAHDVRRREDALNGGGAVIVGVPVSLDAQAVRATVHPSVLVGGEGQGFDSVGALRIRRIAVAPLVMRRAVVRASACGKQGEEPSGADDWRQGEKGAGGQCHFNVLSFF